MAFFTLPSAQDRGLIPEGRLTGPMPWVIAIMMFLTILAAAAGLSVRASADRVNADLAGRVTVQIVEANPDLRAEQAGAAVEALSKIRLVEKVEPVSETDVEEMLAPWIGSDGLDDTIPIPALIDLDLNGPATEANLDEIRDLLTDIAPAARIDAHGSWLKPVFNLLKSLQYLALGLVLLLAFATSATVLLAARSALDTHRETIDIMHLLGATDGQITRLFQRRIGLDAGFGGAVGIIAALMVLFFIAVQMGEIGSGLLESGLLRWHDWAILALIPIGGIVLAMLTARVTIMRALRKML
ncbi:cell division protein [Sphingorhabdus sp. Alg239-R122]|uniref:cell division protein FtsX n=1 Tax=Sphingorhabdus sp. Alg239-R122 TaxID=2305989 RepID=UPI0013DA3FE3|nr:cell division protein [Sphingorhabdus sp. Alg239-R122]